MSFPFFENPEEVILKIREEQERRHMSEEAFFHGFERMFEEMPLDHLQILRQILATSCGDQHASTFYEGMVVATMKYRFNICMSHGVNHEAEVEDMANTKFESVQSMKQPESDEPLPLFDSLSQEDLDRMKEYHLDDLRDEDTNELLGFVCTGILGMNGPCGMRYPSIEDRMLRDPESCSGCFVRMSQG